jgi:hypothetical protein
LSNAIYFRRHERAFTTRYAELKERAPAAALAQEDAQVPVRHVKAQRTALVKQLATYSEA